MARLVRQGVNILSLGPSRGRACAHVKLLGAESTKTRGVGDTVYSRLQDQSVAGL